MNRYSRLLKRSAIASPHPKMVLFGSKIAVSQLRNLRIYDGFRVSSCWIANIVAFLHSNGIASFERKQ